MEDYEKLLVDTSGFISHNIYKLPTYYGQKILNLIVLT